MLSVPTISLYEQTEREVIPIIDFIPAESGGQLPISEIWKLKEVLDQSQIRVVEATSERQRGADNYLTTEVRLADITRRANSIIQNSSNCSILSQHNEGKEIPIVPRERLNTQKGSQKEGSRPFNSQYSVNKCSNLSSNKQHHNRERLSKVQDGLLRAKRLLLLREIDSSFRVEDQSVFKREQIGKFMVQKKKLLSLISNKLEISKRIAPSLYGSEISKSIAKQNKIDSSSNGAASNLVGKRSKLVEVKNALREAALDSSKRSVASSKKPDKEEAKQNLSMIKGTTDQKPREEQQFALVSFNTGQFPDGLQQSAAEQQSTNFNKWLNNDDTRRQEGVFTFSEINAVPLTFLRKHEKSVSIDVEESEFKDISQTKADPISQLDCAICRVVGKRCGFH